MCGNVLTFPHKAADLRGSAINCTSEIGENVSRYLCAAVSPATRDAYASDLNHYEAWGGTYPSTPMMLANYLASFAGRLSVATLNRRLAAIASAHLQRGLLSPTRDDLVRRTMQGIRRVHRRPQRQAKPISRDDICSISNVSDETLSAFRDRALLLVGFNGAFRRSELARLEVADIELSDARLAITLCASKTDQFGVGRRVHILAGEGRNCPILALRQWLELSGIASGPIFRRIDRHGNIGSAALSGHAVGLILKNRVNRAHLDVDGISAHSLRSGFATSAAATGKTNWQIRAVTGHRSDAMLNRYVHLDALSGSGF